MAVVPCRASLLTNVDLVWDIALFWGIYMTLLVPDIVAGVFQILGNSGCFLWLEIDSRRQ